MGASLGKYRLESLIGVGGTAAVYRATHRNGHRVAVKVLSPWLAASPEVRERFLKEGYAANAVEHPCVARVLDDDQTNDGGAFLVMELLTGHTVADACESAGGKLPVVEVARIARDVLDVLAIAHARGIIHRDIKPGNLFITQTGQLKVLDFGIARMRDAVKTFTPTRTGRTMGTPAFMAPEQALGFGDKIDGRTDLWAVGATMFTLLSGVFVHEAETPEALLVYSATRPARSLRTVVSADVPQALIDVVDRALAFDRDHRFADAASMRDALDAALRQLPSPPAFGSSIVPAPVPTIVQPVRSVMTTTGLGATSGSLPPPPPPPRSGGWAFAVAGLLLVASAIVAVLVAIPFARREMNPRLAEHSASAFQNLVTACAAVKRPPPAVDVPVVAEPAAKPKPAKRGAKPAATSAEGASPSCDPPYVIDPLTHGRRVKPGC